MLACCFAIAALGFGIAGFAAGEDTAFTGFLPSVFCDAAVFVPFAFGRDAIFAAALFAAGPLVFAVVFLTFALAAGFLAAATFGSNFFSVSSNAGLGSVTSCGSVLVGTTRVVTRVGLDPVELGRGRLSGPGPGLGPISTLGPDPVSTVGPDPGPSPGSGPGLVT